MEETGITREKHRPAAGYGQQSNSQRLGGDRQWLYSGDRQWLYSGDRQWLYSGDRQWLYRNMEV